MPTLTRRLACLLTLVLAPALSRGAGASAEPASAHRPAAASTSAARTPVLTDAAVAPLFTKGDLARAGADLEAGHFAEAARGFATSPAPEARYLRALALVQATGSAEALPALAGLERLLPELSDRVLFLRARALEAGGDGEGAARAYALVPETSLTVEEARLARARLLDLADDLPGALQALAPLLAPRGAQGGTPGGPPEALLLAGQLRARLGDAAAARALFLGCWAGHPVSGLAATCLAELRRLPGAAGEAPRPEEALRRAEALQEANRQGTALAELSPLVDGLPEPGPDEPLACRARAALGRALRRQRQPTRAVEVLRPVVERCTDPQVRVRALYVLASAAAIALPEEGVERYRQLAREYPDHPLADDALFYAADGLARLDRVDEALTALRELAGRYSQGDFAAEALFRTAWLEKRSGQLEAALETLRRLERERENDPYEYARAVYWRARFQAARGAGADTPLAREAWRQLVERFPADYYGLLARSRLEEQGAAPAWPRLPPPDEADGFRYAPGPLLADRHFLAGLRLLRMGQGKVAAQELLAAERKGLETEPALLLAELLDRAGDPRSAHALARALARTLLRQQPEGIALRAWRAAYPRAYRAEVERWASPLGVPPDLLLALMREESGLDPAVVSGAGAVGLTQLMLPTAQAEAKKLGMGRLSSADLTRPPVAIRIGASYLGGLLRRHGGSEVLALAAYNVGEVPVRSWLEARGGLPLDAFVEEIPVEETRGYVKRVLRSYATYRWLYPTREEPVLLGQALPARRR